MDEIIREDALSEAENLSDTICFYLREHAETKEQADEIKEIFIKAFTKMFTQYTEDYKLYLEEIESA